SRTGKITPDSRNIGRRPTDIRWEYASDNQNPHLNASVLLHRSARRQGPALFSNYGFKGFVKPTCRLPAQQLLHSSNIGKAPLHVFEPVVVDLVIGNVDKLGVASAELLHTLSQSADGYFFCSADVEQAAGCICMLSQSDYGRYHIAHITKTATLVSVPVDRDRHPFQGLSDEPRDDHAIATGLPRTNRVEKAKRDDR